MGGGAVIILETDIQVAVVTLGCAALYLLTLAVRWLLRRRVGG